PVPPKTLGGHGHIHTKMASSHWMSPASFRVLWPDVGPEGRMKHMAGRQRHSAEDIVRKLRRADELSGFVAALASPRYRVHPVLEPGCLISLQLISQVTGWVCLHAAAYSV